MGKIRATCGHEITDEWFVHNKGSIATKEHTREGQRCTSYRLVCEKCLPTYKDIILKNKAEEKKWLKEGK